MPFTSFSCLIAIVRSSNTMLNKSGNSWHPCLVLDVRGNAFSFSLLSMMSVAGLSYMGFIMLYSLYAHFVKSLFFLHKWMLNFVRSFFCIY